MERKQFAEIIKFDFKNYKVEEIEIYKNINSLILVDQSKNIEFFKAIKTLCTEYINELENPAPQPPVIKTPETLPFMLNTESEEKKQFDDTTMF